MGSDGTFNVGEYYMDANGVLSDRVTYYKTDGTTGVYDYDVEIAQTELGVADFSTEEIKDMRSNSSIN